MELFAAGDYPPPMLKRSGILLLLMVGSALLAACGATPPAVSATMQQIAQAVQAKDKNALKACYARVSAPDDLAIQQSLGSWDEYLDNWTYSGVSYKTMADMAADPQEQPFISAYQSQKIAGTSIVMAPNLPVIGFITVSFKQGTQNASAIEPIGLMPDGSARIVIVRQQ
jgi:hypothetical protein